MLVSLEWQGDSDKYCDKCYRLQYPDGTPEEVEEVLRRQVKGENPIC